MEEHEAWKVFVICVVVSVPLWFLLDATLGRLVRWVHRND